MGYAQETVRDAKTRARAFLAAYEECGDIKRAASSAEMDRRLHYRWLKDSPGYAAAFARARDRFADRLEAEAIRRANEGVLEPVFYQGQKIGAIRRYSDGLMQFLLRGARPEKYSQKTEISGPGGEPIQTRIEVVLVRPRDSENPETGE